MKKRNGIEIPEFVGVDGDGDGPLEFSDLVLIELQSKPHGLGLIKKKTFQQKYDVPVTVDNEICTMMFLFIFLWFQPLWLKRKWWWPQQEASGGVGGEERGLLDGDDKWSWGRGWFP
ncbi:hypothetical protein L6452_18780 [Arctium lappa]|uniref:Uncharacterized protein n=1 Tax=Arctium lappa TaxID=4217 RepID=A0ACB9C796_ARCLA|nr:hypothetical protein L6452_18780 [Arctium lappa]